ncbi:RluA family pseudouridine synthase [Alicyclobacillus curvatus]|jgi:RluA family pseudouridine synthase|nr:RluA family pseudouridine synthase [Alicyclobacillus curvatus]
MVNHTVGPMEAGKKVHRLVRQLLPGVPLSGIHKMLRVGRVRLNGKKAKPDTLVAEGDVIELRMAEEDFAAVSKPIRKYQGVPRELDVIYEDETLLAVNKPVGLLTHGAGEEQRDTLTNRVLAYLHDKEALDASAFVPAPANRLDRNTSGIILFGKTGAMARELADGFKTHTIRKWYLAVVKGAVTSGGKVTASLARDTRRNITRVDEELGKSAFTLYHPLASARNTSILRLELISGRTHQIRIHMKHIGHPLLSDRKYQATSQRSNAIGPGGSGRRIATDSGTRRTHAAAPSFRHAEASQVESDPTYLLHAAWVRLPSGQLLHAPVPESFRSELGHLGYTDDVIRKVELADPEKDAN